MGNPIKGLYVPDNHISMTSSSEVIEICDPILATIGINFFFHGRHYADGRTAVVITDNMWHRHVFANVPHIGPPKLPPHVNLVSYHGLWEGNVNDMLMKEARQFNIYHPFAFVEIKQDHMDCWTFASGKNDSNIINFYFNNLDFLQKFIGYFKERTEKLWKLSIKEAMVVSKELQAKPISQETLNSILKQDFGRFLPQASIQGKIGKVHLTPREISCLKELLHGRTMKETGLILEISPRTVETHLKRIKTKLGCYSKGQIIDLLQQHYLFD